MNLKFYSLKIYDYNENSDPEVERYVRISKRNFEFLKQECEDYWSNNDNEFSWYNGTYSNGCKYWTWNNDDCLYATISEEILYLNADKSTTMETE